MRRRTESGFSLIEVLIAVTVFVIALAGIMALMLTTVRANASSTAGTDAVGVAERFLEELRARSGAWRGVLPLSNELCHLNTDDATGWILPMNTTTCPSMSRWSDGAAHDSEGRGTGDANLRKRIYCVHYRVRWMPDQTYGTPTIGQTDEVMVTVRVAYTADASESWANCSVATVNAALAAGGNARAVVVPMVLRKSPP